MNTDRTTAVLYLGSERQRSRREETEPDSKVVPLPVRDRPAAPAVAVRTLRPADGAAPLVITEVSSGFGRGRVRSPRALRAA